MKVVLTGATGFVGSHMAESLIEAGAVVYAVARNGSSRGVAQGRSDSPGILHWIGPDEVKYILNDEKPDAVLHLATHFLKSHTEADIAPLIQSNVEFGTRVLDSIDPKFTKFVYASSYFQFYEGRPRPTSLYAASKQAFSGIVDYYVGRGLQACEVVLYDNFGPRDKRHKLVPLLMDSAVNRTALGLGPRNQLVNLTYIGDICDGLSRVLLGETSAQRLTLRHSEPITVGEFVDTMVKTLGIPLDVTFAERDPDNELVLKAGDWPGPKGWEPKTPLIRAIADTFSALVSTTNSDDCTRESSK